MVSGTRSSKRRSSPSYSLKKKRRNKDRSKKRCKLGRSKSKKVSRRGRSESYSDDESLSDSSVSYSSTDSDHRRSRSRTRKDTGRRRKKSRRSRLKRESSEDTIQVRKNKRLKRSIDVDAKKKCRGRTRKRKPSVSSSSRSLSCSTCGSSDDSEREYESAEKRVRRSGRSRSRRSLRSRSCSSCGFSSDSETECESTEKRVKRSGKSRRDLDVDRSSHGHRSRSCSLCSLHSGDDSYQNQEQMLNENGSRRLRSVIISAKECEEFTKQLDGDEHKEEIMCDRDDYPASRRNDNNDGETRRDDFHDAQAVPEQTGCLEDKHEEMDVSTVNISKLSGSREHGTMECDVNVPTFHVAGVKDSSKENTSAGAVSSDANLEAILRKKALENLRKFKGRVRANPNNPVSTKGSCDGEGKESFGLNANSELKDQEGSAGGVVASSVPHQFNMSNMMQEKSKVSGSNINISVSALSDEHKEDKMAFKKEHIATDTFMRKARPLKESSHINSSVAESLPSLAQDTKMVASFGEGRALTFKEGGEGGASTLKTGHVGADKFPTKVVPTQESYVENMPTSGIRCAVENLQSPSNDAKGLIDSVVHVNDKHETGALIPILQSNKFQTERTPIQESSTPDISIPAQHTDTVESLQSTHDTKMVFDDVEKTSSTGLSASDSSNLQGQSSNTKENEDEGSQFQQKTMSVMRGGEMVQVSYKVYIPKRAPALARRKLKR